MVLENIIYIVTGNWIVTPQLNLRLYLSSRHSIWAWSAVMTPLALGISGFISKETKHYFRSYIYIQIAYSQFIFISRNYLGVYVVQFLKLTIRLFYSNR